MRIMEKIKKSIPFGKTFLDYHSYVNEGGGFEVVCPSDGHYVVCTEADGDLHEEHEYKDNIIAPKSRPFKRVASAKDTVYVISTKSIVIKGFLSVSGRDHEFGNVPTEFNLTYDLTVKVADNGRIALVQYAREHWPFSPVEDDKLKDDFGAHIASCIRSAIIKYLKKYNPTDIMIHQEQIANEIATAFCSFAMSKIDLFDVSLI